jgi:hypothetical protein
MKEENGSEVNTGGGKLAGNVMRSTLQAHIFEKLLKIWAELISVVSTQLRRNTAWVLREQWHVLKTKARRKSWVSGKSRKSRVNHR